MLSENLKRMRMKNGFRLHTSTKMNDGMNMKEITTGRTGKIPAIFPILSSTGTLQKM